jgi:hypothetical protein
MDPSPTINQAADAIWDRFQGQLERGWLSTIGIGILDNKPAIVIYTRHDPLWQKGPLTPEGEAEVRRLVGPQDYPVVVKHMDRIYPLRGAQIGRLTDDATIAAGGPAGG